MSFQKDCGHSQIRGLECCARVDIAVGPGKTLQVGNPSVSLDWRGGNKHKTPVRMS